MPSDGFIKPEVCVQHDFFVLSFQPFITIEYNDNDIDILVFDRMTESHPDRVWNSIIASTLCEGAAYYILKSLIMKRRN